MDMQITPLKKFLAELPPGEADRLQNLYGSLFRPSWDQDRTLWLAEIIVAVGHRIQRGLGHTHEKGAFRATASAVATDPDFRAWLTVGLTRFQAIGK